MHTRQMKSRVNVEELKLITIGSKLTKHRQTVQITKNIKLRYNMQRAKHTMTLKILQLLLYNVEIQMPLRNKVLSWFNNMFS